MLVHNFTYGKQIFRTSATEIAEQVVHKKPVVPIILSAYLPVVIRAFIFGTVVYRYCSQCGFPVLVYQVVKNCRYLPVISIGINTGMPLW